MTASVQLQLSDIEFQRFADVVNASLDVSTRHQLFVWMQSSFHALVPHEILICGVDDGSRQGMGMHRFSASRYFKQEHFDHVSDARIGLMPLLVAAAQRLRDVVVLCPDEDSRADADPALLALVIDNEMKNLGAMLVMGPRGNLEAFYGFARIACPLDRRLAHFMKLLVPHLHSAFLRVLAFERGVAGSSAQRSGRLVTPRQQEILQLIQSGKTNAEIAEYLSCSPWTVKNHVQAILRKLDSNSRGHAISRAMSLGLLRPD